MLSEEIERYEKQIPVIGVKGQIRLKEGRVVVVGAGGLGCPALMQLASTGVGCIGIIDGDAIERSNLPRQTLFSAPDIGEKKAEVATTRLQQMNPHVFVTPYVEFLDASNIHRLLDPYEIVIDATDRALSRYELAQHCEATGKVHIYGAVEGMIGQVATFNVSDDNNTTYSYTDLFPEPLPTACSCAETGILGGIPNSIGILQAFEAINLLLGESTPLQSHLLLVNYRTHTQDLIALCPNPRAGRAYRRRRAEKSVITTISPATLNELLQSPIPPLLIDVRDKTESDEKHIGGLWIPLHSLPKETPTLPTDRPTILYCQTGRRSALAAQILKNLFPERDIRCLEQRSL